MNYSALKRLDRIDAARMVLEGEVSLGDKRLNYLPYYPDVVVYGDTYAESYDGIADFLIKYVQPESERDVSIFFEQIARRIVSDPLLDDSETRKHIHVNYRILYTQHFSLFKKPDTLSEWAEMRGTYFWYEYIIIARREAEFKKIIKKHDDDELLKISYKIRKVYGFSDREMTYLQYFCSIAKLDDVDSSLNVSLYNWSKKKFTGKSTVSEYICSFLNGETTKNADKYKSDLATEMQIGRFDIPVATTARCVMLDEAGFKDMSKTYNKLKTVITSNTCNIEYKYKSSKKPKKCHRNYIWTSNDDPIYLVKDEEERRILSVHFKKPEKMSFAELEKMWYKFVLECNFDEKRLTEIYENVIEPNPQAGESKLIIEELKDILSHERINSLTSKSYFSLSNVMTMPEITQQKNDINRKLVKEALIQLYGSPDPSQRFHKSNRAIMENCSNSELDLPF